MSEVQNASIRRMLVSKVDVVEVDKSTDELQQERSAYERLKLLDEYKGARVGSRFVSTPFAPEFPLKGKDAVLLAFASLRRLHVAKVIHGDLKNEHVRENAQGVFFIDFGCSRLTPLQEATGNTSIFASLDVLLRNTVHPLDDYEALLVAALYSSDAAKILPKPPASRRVVAKQSEEKESLGGPKSWLQWKVAVMHVVYAHRSSQDPLILYLVGVLMRVWTTPREVAWLNDTVHDAIVADTPFDADAHRERLWKVFKSMLSRTRLSGGVKVSHWRLRELSFTCSNPCLLL